MEMVTAAFWQLGMQIIAFLRPYKHELMRDLRKKDCQQLLVGRPNEHCEN